MSSPSSGKSPASARFGGPAPAKALRIEKFPACYMMAKQNQYDADVSAAREFDGTLTLGVAFHPPPRVR